MEFTKITLYRYYSTTLRGRRVWVGHVQGIVPYEAPVQTPKHLSSEESTLTTVPTVHRNEPVTYPCHKVRVGENKDEGSEGMVQKE